MIKPNFIKDVEIFTEYIPPYSITDLSFQNVFDFYFKKKSTISKEEFDKITSSIKSIVLNKKKILGVFNIKIIKYEGYYYVCKKTNKSIFFKVKDIETLIFLLNYTMCLSNIK